MINVTEMTKMNLDQQLVEAIKNSLKFEVIQDLINGGADVKTKDKNGLTPLMWAAMYNQNPEVISYLIEAGADVNAKDDKYGQTPLIFAVMYNQNPDVILVLIEAGSDVDTKTNEGKSVLDYTKESGDNFLIELMKIRRNGSVDLKSLLSKNKKKGELK